jgi:hypothetical protein
VDDHNSETPPTVIGAVAAGVAPMPFLAVYATLFIARGGFRPVNPPDITNSAHGELMAGFAAAAIFVVGAISIYWLAGGRRRWLFAIGQLATLGTSIYFVANSDSGPAAVPFLLILTSALALVLAFMPASTGYLRAHRHERRSMRGYPDPVEASVDVR